MRDNRDAAELATPPGLVHRHKPSPTCPSKNQVESPLFGKRDSSTSGPTTAISATPPSGQVTVPQGLHSKCSPTLLPMQIEHPSGVLICVLTHARAGMYLALTVSVSLSLFVI